MNNNKISRFWELLNNAISKQNIFVTGEKKKKDPLEEEMATQTSILTWEIPWIEKHGGLLSTEWQKNQIQLSN